MKENNEAESARTNETSARQTEEQSAPIYIKPALRKYDQIEQVKPYGPSEREAG